MLRLYAVVPTSRVDLVAIMLFTAVVRVLKVPLLRFRTDSWEIASKLTRKVL